MRKLFYYTFFALLPVLANAQVDCSNIGFELGNTSGWQLSYGTVDDENQKVVYLNETDGTRDNEHYVTSASDGNDPKIAAISAVAPGSTHSIRIGNTSTGTHFTRIKTQYLVTADNTLFQYKFAVLLQNTSGGMQNHEPYQKPGFNIEIFDSNGDALTCSNYDIQLQGNNTVDGFQTSGDIQYRNWTTGAIDLQSYVGKTITIVVTAHGCTQRGHFGYAYFDAQCLKSEINTASNCPDQDGYMTLVAPSGFGKYTWNNGETTQSIKVKANLGDKFSVKLVPLASLEASCSFSLEYKIRFNQASYEFAKSICEGEEVAVGDTVYKTSGIFIRNVSKSNVCDSIVTLHLTVNPRAAYTQDLKICKGEQVTVGDSVYSESGTYTNLISLPTGCDSLVTTNLEVKEVDLSVTPNVSIVAGEVAELHAMVSPAGSYTYNWTEAAGLSCPTCPDTKASPVATTIYTVSVIDNENVCNEQGRVTVTVKPCGIMVPDIFTPNQDGKNEVFFVYGNSCVKQVSEMTIFDRWGQVIFYKINFVASDPASGWDGNYKGVSVNAGSYPYKIKVELNNGEKLDYSGAITLVR